MRKPKKKKFTGNFTRVSISKELDKVIISMKKEMQIMDNQKYGRNARNISYLWASDELAKMLKRLTK